MRYSQYQAYAAQFPGKEVIDGVLYDTVQYPQAGALRLTFFNALRATIDLSNMRAAGQLPYPEEFCIRAIRFYVKAFPESTATAAAASVQLDAVNVISQMVNTGVLQLNIGQKDYGIYPLSNLPAGGGPFGVIVVNNVLIAGAACSFANNGYPHIRNTFTLAKPITIPSQMNFNVTITWAALAPVIRATNVTVALEGDLIRAIQ